MLLQHLPNSREDPDLFVSMAGNESRGGGGGGGAYHDQDAQHQEGLPDGIGNDNLDDVWGDDGGDGSDTGSIRISASATTSGVHPSDMPRLQQEHTTAGYRDGVTVSKAQSVQAGFDEGFGLGATIGGIAGQLLGVLEGLVSAVQAHLPESEDMKRLENLLKNAEGDLSVQAIFGEAYWAADGTWKYEVEDASKKTGEEDEVVFSHIAEAHPLIKKWNGVVRAEAHRYGLIWDVGSLLPHDEDEDGGGGGHGHGHGHDHGDAGKKKDGNPVRTSREALAW